MIFLALITLFLNEKINAKRVIMVAALTLILLNPYIVFNISFQLSFAAILVLANFHQNFAQKNFNRHFLSKFFWYFLEIIFLSIILQIATLPFLMYSFQNIALLGFVANIMAIPLVSFFIMPLGFLSLLTMPFALEKFPLIFMKEGIFLIEKIAVFTANLNYSHLTSPQLSSLGLVIAIFGLLLICLTKTELRFLGVILFLLSFSTIFFNKKPDILFDSKQKFFALYDEKNGLVFSKKIRASKQRESWMKELNEHQFKSLENFSDEWKKMRGIFCDEKKCIIERNQKILVLLKRNKISEICRKNFIENFDLIVNLTAKYELPACISENQIKIDNFDFYHKSGHFLYLKNDEILLKTAS